MSTHAFLQVPTLPYPKIGSGKVREIYDAGDSLLIIATDRISAFDYILSPGIPGKGEILTQITHLWLDLLTPFIRHHRFPAHQQKLEKVLKDYPELWLRTMIVHKLAPFPIEAVVRGYLTGSAWKSYQKDGTAGEFVLPEGILESASLGSPLFTPSTKATEGHDESIDFSTTVQLIGIEHATTVRDWSRTIYRFAEILTQRVGLVLADTKFEFGTDIEDQVWLIDEILTPDSSRYWPQEDYQPGAHPSSFDKQYVRDFLLGSHWDFQSSPPELPDEIILGTQNRYLEAWKRLQKLRLLSTDELNAAWQEASRTTS